MGFTHLHVHSCYSILDSVSTPLDVCLAARSISSLAIAITDHDNINVWPYLLDAAKQTCIKPILGVEFNMVNNTKYDYIPRVNNQLTGRTAFHLTAWAISDAGTYSLCSMLKRRQHMPNSEIPVITWSDIANSEDVIFGSACSYGLVPNLILNGKQDEALSIVGKFLDIVGKDRFYLELMAHGLSTDHVIINGLLDIHKRTGAHLLVTNDVHHLHVSEVLIRNLLVGVRTNGKFWGIQNTGDLLLMESPDVLKQRLSGIPEEAWTNTQRIVDAVHYWHPCIMNTTLRKVGIDRANHWIEWARTVRPDIVEQLPADAAQRIVQMPIDEQSLSVIQCQLSNNSF